MKRKSIFGLLILIILIIFSSCSPDVPGKISYIMPTSEETWNTIEISGKKQEGFFLEASCCNASLNIGEFKGYFKFESPETAVFYGESYEGIDYKITAEFNGDKLVLSVQADEEYAEHELLQFGMNVYLSGNYVKQ